MMSKDRYGEWRDVIRTALDIAAAAPSKQNRYAFAASVPWPLIHELREALKAQGLDWKEVKGS